MRNKIMATPSAMIHCCPTVDDPSPDPSFCDPQVKGALDLGTRAHAMRPLQDSDQVDTPALRTLCGGELNILAGFYASVAILAQGSMALPQSLVRAEKDTLTLVIEVGVLVYEVEVRIHKGLPSHGVAGPVEFSDGSDAQARLIFEQRFAT